MSSIYRIKENMNEYTETELKIAKYILDHKDFVIASSAQKVAHASGTSAAALVRFAKRLGYSGYTQLKLELAKAPEEQSEPFDSIILDNDNLEVLVKKVQYNNNKTFENTYKLLNLNDLENTVTHMNKAHKIYLFGIGASSIVCEDLYQKLIRINREVYYHYDLHLGISALTHATKDDIVIAISYSGETKEIIKTQRIAQEQGLNTVAITQTGKTTLDRYSDTVFKVPKEEAELRLGSISSRFAMLVLTDLFYLGLAQGDIQTIRENIIKTKLNTEKFSK